MLDRLSYKRLCSALVCMEQHMKHLLLVAALLLGGCNISYTKPDFTQAQFDRDVARCKFEAMRRDGVAWPDEVDLCMKGNGYTRS